MIQFFRRFFDSKLGIALTLVFLGLIALAFEEYGQPGAEWAWLALGSTARREASLAASASSAEWVERSNEVGPIFCVTMKLSFEVYVPEVPVRSTVLLRFRRAG